MKKTHKTNHKTKIQIKSPGRQAGQTCGSSPFRRQRNGTGVKQWAETSVNICQGCPHDCLYCYAKAILVTRFKRIRATAWSQPKLLDRNMAAAGQLRAKGVIMFPTTHDITPGILPQALATLQTLLDNGNRVLVVSKPHLSVVQTLCATLQTHRDSIMFRFTIGSADPSTCCLWEPGAPPPDERIAALEHAHACGYQTSVSMEPMLEDKAHMMALVHRVTPFTTDTIWLGKLNGIVLKSDQNKPGVAAALGRLRAAQSDQHLVRLYDALHSNPKVRWKDSVRKVLRRHGIQV